MARTKGAKNKITIAVKDAVEHAFNTVNRDGMYLVNLAHDDPKTFCSLVSRCIPSAVAISVSHTIDLSEAMIEADKNIKRLEAEYKERGLSLGSKSKMPVIENEPSD